MCGQLLQNFLICFPSSLRQDLMVKDEKKSFLIVWASWARNGSFEVFFETKDLCFLGVNNFFEKKLVIVCHNYFFL
jgi:hypothetical protein